jgi:hypothetical protein
VYFFTHFCPFKKNIDILNYNAYWDKTFVVNVFKKKLPALLPPRLSTFSKKYGQNWPKIHCGGAFFGHLRRTLLLF